MTDIDALMHRLRQSGAAAVDAVGWQYIELLAKRRLTVPAPAQTLLDQKLGRLLSEFEDRMGNRTRPDAPPAPGTSATPSPLAQLLHAMTSSAAPPQPRGIGDRWTGPAESPRVRQFRQQLRTLQAHKQVSQAMAQAPQNAGPINSHMLVLRALGLLRNISPDYLNRLMTHVDTLLCLEAAERQRMPARKSASSRPSRGRS